MQKRANRILSALIALVMVLSMLPAAVFATGDTASVLEGWNIALGDNVGVNFRLNSADYTVTTTVNGEAVTPAISDNLVTVNVAAAQMNDPIVLTVKNGEETVHTGEYSVRQYAEYILEGDYANYVKNMVLQTLNYGAAAQTYFDYNADNLANAGYELEASEEISTEVPAISLEDNLAGISLYGISLVFRNKIAVRFYFKTTEDIANFTFSQGTPEQKDGMYYIEVGNINPQELANDITLSVNDGALSVTYSPLNYIVRKYNDASSSAELKALVQAMYGYHLEAKYYSNVTPVTGLANHNAAWNIDPETGTGGIYILHDAHDATYDGGWAAEYKPVSADAIKLVRDGVTYDVACPGNGTLVVYSATEMYLKLESWTIGGEKLPLVDGDQLIIGGEFKHDASGDVLAIEKTTVEVRNGSFGINAISVGALGNHASGVGGDGVYMTMAENNAVYNADWSLEYAPLTANAYRVIRDGVETNIGQPGRGTLVKFGATEGYIKHSGWCVNDFAAQTSDIFIIEGLWKHTAGKTVIQIDKTYMYHNGATWVLATSLPTVYEAGVLQTHESGMDGNGIYVRTAANDAPSNSDWSLEYKQTSADNIKLVRNGETVSIGIADRPLLIKLNECDYYLKLEEWTIGAYGLNSTNPITTEDMLIIEGDFFYAAENVTLNITKSYVYYDGTAWVCAAAEPVPETIYEVGVLSAHSAGGTASGIYATGLENDAPYYDWAAEYAPTSKECIQIIRGDETIYRTNTGAGAIIKLGGTGYYVKFDTWIDSTNYPLQAGDLIIIEGIFVGTGNYAEAEGVKIKIDKTYVSYDGTSFTFSATEPGTTNVVAGGNLTESADGWDAAGEIFSSLAENDLPVDENAEVEYTAQAGVIKLVRGETTSELSGTVVKYSATDYYMVLSGDTLPLQNKDYLIVEGNFTNADNGYTLNVAKTYILVDGENLVYSTTVPEITTTIDVGVLQASSNGAGSGGIYFQTAETNDAPWGDWNTYYDSNSIDNIKLIRNGETVSIGLTDRNTICKFGANDYYLKLEEYTIGEYAPFTTDDMFIVEGAFTHKDSKTTLNIAKTYIYHNGASWVLAADLPVVYEAGVLKTHETGLSGKGIYVRTEANDAPFNSDWSLEYKQTSVDNIKIVRGDETISVGIVGRPLFVRLNECDYYLKLENWTISAYGLDSTNPITTEDMLIIEGDFYYENVTLNITKSYVYYDGTAWVCAAAEPVPETIYEVGVLSANSSGGSATGIYATGLENDAPYSDWAAEYAPSSKECIQIIRNGETIYRENTGAGAIIKLGGTDYYVKFDTWIDSTNYPLQAGDLIIIEGVFVGTGNYAEAEGVKIKIDKTYVSYDGTSFTFSATEPEEDTSYKVGNLTANSAGFAVDGNGFGIYANCTATNATYNGDWSVEYTPAAAENYKLIRNGVTYNVGMPGQGTIVMISQTSMYLKQQSWTFSTNAIDNELPLQAGDILVVEGKWNCIQDASSVIEIDTTYITIGSGSASFSAEDPRILKVGNMYAQGGSNWSGDGINFAVDADAAPYNADWSVEYVPASDAVIKLIRNGQTTNIANTGAGTIVKLGEDNCFLKLEQWMIGSVYPITDGDVLIVEGEFKQANGDYSMVIDKTYIVIGAKADDEVTFTTQYAETDFGTVVLPTSTDTLNIGMWNGSYHVFEHKQLQELKDAGITKIMGVNTQWIGTEDVNAWLDRVYSYGISVIMDLRDWDGTTVPSYVNHPGLMGFLMYDEPSADVFSDLAALKAQFDAVMPAGKLFYVNLFPECAADSSLGTESSWWESILGDEKDYDTDYVTAFLNALDIQVLSWDNYSLIRNSENVDGIRLEYFHNFEVMAAKNKTLWYTMLSAGHTAGASDTYYDTPTAEELRWQMAVAMTYGVQNIDHYVYTSHEDNYSCMVEYEDADGDGVYWETTNLYNDILAVDNEYLAWDNIFTAYDWIGVGAYDTGSSNTMLSVLENKLTLSSYGLTVTSSSEDLLVGVFENNGNKAYMVTNAGSIGSTTVGDGKNFSMADTSVTLTLADGNYKCAAVINNGEITYVAVNNNQVTLNVEAYEGVFVIPVLN